MSAGVEELRVVAELTGGAHLGDDGSELDGRAGGLLTVAKPAHRGALTLGGLVARLSRSDPGVKWIAVRCTLRSHRDRGSDF
jgi:hypothetical protein